MCRRKAVLGSLEFGSYLGSKILFVVLGSTLARGVRGVGDGVIDLIALVSDDAVFAAFASLPPSEP